MKSRTATVETPRIRKSIARALRCGDVRDSLRIARYPDTSSIVAPGHSAATAANILSVPSLILCLRSVRLQRSR
jgi:hypothetical protein